MQQTIAHAIKSNKVLKMKKRYLSPKQAASCIGPKLIYKSCRQLPELSTTVLCLSLLSSLVLTQIFRKCKKSRVTYFQVPVQVLVLSPR